jgi:hypothetical protein
VVGAAIRKIIFTLPFIKENSLVKIFLKNHCKFLADNISTREGNLWTGVFG